MTGEDSAWADVNEGRLIDKRVSELKRLHGMREAVAETVAHVEVGYSSSGAARELGVTEGTVKSRIDHVEDLHGHMCVQVRATPSDVSGELSGSPDLSTCPMTDCRESKVVSLASWREVYTSPPAEAKSAAEAAEATDKTHLCLGCFRTFSVVASDGGVDVSMPDVLTELFGYDQWVARRRSDKKPVAPWTNGDVSPADASNFYNQTSARSVLEWESKLSGTPDAIAPGFYLTTGDPFVVVDLDDCRDAESGSLSDFAAETMDTLGGYAEVSPSGTGVHVVVRGEIPSNVRTKGFEMYSSGQYVTVTFDHVDGTPTEPVAAQGALDALWDEHGGELPTPSEPRGFDGDAPEDPLYRLNIGELYDRPLGGKTTHPVHGSSTGENFRTFSDGPSLFHCFRCGVSGNVSQLLAMEYLAEVEGESRASMSCAEVTRRWGHDDELVSKTWAWAVGQGHIPSSPVPRRVDPSLIDGE